MVADSIGSTLLYLVISIGFAWPVAVRLAYTGPEKILASVSLSLIGVYLFAWAVYILALPLAMFWTLPIASVAMVIASWRSLAELWRDPEARDLLIAQTFVTTWCIGWLALVATYSGGGWAGDWFGHWYRTVFFLERGPHDILFNGFDPLTSRPPLANIVTGALVAVTGTDFAHYQLALTFLGSLAFLPAALVARRFGGRQAIATLAVLVMINAMFVENATFAWTKLLTAFFVLAAIYFFLRGSNCVRDGLLFAVTVSAAILSHYSAGPYAVIMAAAWIVEGWSKRHAIEWWRQTTYVVLAALGILLTWFGWSLLVFGAKGTFLTNTSVTDKAPTIGAQLVNVALNIRDTIVPHFLRKMDYAYIAQQSPWGWWRDWFFQLYQVNLLFALGSVAWLAIAVTLLKAGRTASRRTRIGWSLAIIGTVLLGIGVHGARDHWGLAHICLQPLVLLGLAFLAAHWDSIGRVWQRVIVAGGTIDLILGVALQFGSESYLFDRWFAPYRAFALTAQTYSVHARINLNAKWHFKLVFFGDHFAAHVGIIIVLLAVLLLMALFRAGQSKSA